jgi:filamentous hemagglutinin
MNKKLHRIVFNKVRGCLMAVAECVSSQGKTASGEGPGGAGAHARAGTFSFGGVGFACKILTGALVAWMPASQGAGLQDKQVGAVSQVVADPAADKAKRPTVLTTSSGVVQVNVQTPSAAGVSRNAYSQFDVGSQGVILNNSRDNVQTVLGGWTQGNPWMAGGSARVIVNEVNSINPSYLQGYVEVAGQRAEVVIANPAGLSISGAGFINASAVTLSTGTPILKDGTIQGWQVRQGVIQVKGQGLDLAGADYAAILARAVQVNAGIWAQRLQIVAGSADTDAASLGTDSGPTVTKVATGGAVPEFVLDVSALGGMYAGKIQLVGTEAGLGVRNAGLLQATSGSLTLSADGWLSNAGTLQAVGGDIKVTSQGPVDQTGVVFSSGHVSIESAKSQSHSGTVAASGDVTLTAKDADSTISASGNAAWVAGLSPSGQLASNGSVQVQAAGTVRAAGQVIATGTAALIGHDIDLTSAGVTGANVTINALDGQLVSRSGQLYASQALSIQAGQGWVNDGGTANAQQVNVHVQSLSNVRGQIVQSGTGDWALILPGVIDNRVRLQHRIRRQRVTLLSREFTEL